MLWHCKGIGSLNLCLSWYLFTKGTRRTNSDICANFSRSQFWDSGRKFRANCNRNPLSATEGFSLGDCLWVGESHLLIFTRSVYKSLWSDDSWHPWQYLSPVDYILYWDVSNICWGRPEHHLMRLPCWLRRLSPPPASSFGIKEHVIASVDTSDLEIVASWDDVPELVWIKITIGQSETSFKITVEPVTLIQNVGEGVMPISLSDDKEVVIIVFYASRSPSLCTRSCISSTVFFSESIRTSCGFLRKDHDRDLQRDFSSIDGGWEQRRARKEYLSHLVFKFLILN